MISIETIEVSGFSGAIKGMRNPYNSWNRSDSHACNTMHCANCIDKVCVPYRIGEEDMKLCKRLIKAGSDHRKFLRMIHVQADVTAPLFWWKQFDVYKVGTTTNSCSTMHTITAKEFELSDFSVDSGFIDYFCSVIKDLNKLRISYLDTKKIEYWNAIIELLPSSYNQLRTIDLDYETLIRMYYARKTHKLSEWHDFCDWIETLPYMKEFLSE